MTTTPATPNLVTRVENDLSWLKNHLILLFLVASLIFGGVYGVENLIAKHEAAKDAQWKTVLATEQQRLTQDESAWQQQFQALAAQNTLLLTAIQKRDTALVVQQKQDSTLSANEAAQRLSEQTKAAPGEVTAQGSDVLMDLPVSRNVVASLDSIPVLTADLKDTKTQLANETIIATNSQNDVTAQKKLNADQVEACKAQVAAVKAQARKTQTKVAAIFTVIGIVAAKFLGI